MPDDLLRARQYRIWVKELRALARDTDEPTTRTLFDIVAMEYEDLADGLDPPQKASSDGAPPASRLN